MSSMPYKVRMSILVEDTEDGGAVRYSKASMTDRPVEEIGVAIADCVTASGWCRQLLMLAYAIEHWSEFHLGPRDGDVSESAEDGLIEAARDLIDYWDKHDKKLDEEIHNGT